MKLLSLLATLLSVTVAYAAQSGSTWATLKESPLDMAYGLIATTSREDEEGKEPKIQGANVYHDMALSYGLTENDQVRVLSEFSQRYGRPSSYDLTEVRYQRSNIWTQADSWADVTFQQRYVYNNDRAKKYGSSSSRLYINRNLSEGFALNNIVRFDVAHKDNASHWGDNTLMLYTAPTWSINDQTSVGLTFRYSHVYPEGDTAPTDKLEMSPSASYKISDAQSVAVAAYITAMQSGDRETFAKNVEDGITYELAYTLSVF